MTKMGIFLSYPLDYWAGGERFSIRLSNYFHGTGYDVKLHSPLNGPNCETRISWDTLAAKTPVPVLRVIYDRGGIPWGHLPFFASYPKVADLERFDVNLVFIHRVPHPKYLASIRRARTRIVFLMQGVAIEEGFLGNPMATAYQAYIKSAIATQSHLLHSSNVYIQTMNSFARSFLIRVGLDPTHIFTIPFAIEAEPYSAVRNDGAFVIAFIGRLVDVTKGLSTLRQTAIRVLRKRLPGLEFVVIGTGPDSRVLSSAVRKFDGFSLRTDVSDFDKGAILSRASLFLSTSNLDPGPATTLEALASGLPVVSTPTAGNKEVLLHRTDLGTITTFHPADIAQCIIRYYDAWRANPEVYYTARLARAAKARLFMDPSAMLTRYRRMVESILAS